MKRGIILAAGSGSRLMPLTADRPKGMVVLAGAPLLMRQISVLQENGISDLTIIGGYYEERLYCLGLPVISNSEFASTNMVESMMRARHLIDGKADVIISYGDIVYETGVLKDLLQNNGEIVVSADIQWERLWQARMDDYSTDIESFRLNSNGGVAELGRKPRGPEDIEAQYIGLFKIGAAVQSRVIEIYDKLDRSAEYDGKGFRNMYMTSFLQILIDEGIDVRPSLIKGGWLEIDSVQDQQCYEAMHNDGNLALLCDLPGLTEVETLVRKILTRVPRDTIFTDLAAKILAAGPAKISIKPMMDCLARKLEISGVLHCEYNWDTGKAIRHRGVASGEEAALLLGCFLLTYDNTGDVRYLNTVIKANQTTLRSPRPAFPGELEQCIAIRLSQL